MCVEAGEGSWNSKEESEKKRKGAHLLDKVRIQLERAEGLIKAGQKRSINKSDEPRISRGSSAHRRESGRLFACQALTKLSLPPPRVSSHTRTGRRSRRASQPCTNCILNCNNKLPARTDRDTRDISRQSAMRPIDSWPGWDKKIARAQGDAIFQSVAQPRSAPFFPARYRIAFNHEIGQGSFARKTRNGLR